LKRDLGTADINSHEWVAFTEGSYEGAWKQLTSRKANKLYSPSPHPPGSNGKTRMSSDQSVSHVYINIPRACGILD